MQKPAADKRKKNDRNDAQFLARQLASRNIVEVWVPDEECEAARDVSRALEDLRDDLVRAKHRLTHLLLRHGRVWDEYDPETGKRRGAWTRAHWEWIRSIELPEPASRDALDLYISEVRWIGYTILDSSMRYPRYPRKAGCHGRPEAPAALHGGVQAADCRPLQQRQAGA